jgi:radical SAM protein with 4Fe4S-binding SPASM domain
MISVSRLLCGTVSPGDSLRYIEKKPETIKAPASATGVPRPVVVWNCTNRCNLRCVHCYINAKPQNNKDSMDTEQGMKFIDDLAEFKVPVILFSGGEPLLRDDLFDLAGHATKKGIRIALSTNGTLIDNKTAGQISNLGFAEVGISLDGISATNDRFRGHKGAYRNALQGIRNCVALGIRVSLRLTITGYNHEEIPAIFDLVEQEHIDRVCFYHLAYSGRGNELREHNITHAQARRAVDTICKRTLDLHARGLPKEVLTVGNHADGVYLHLKAREHDPAKAAMMLELLRSNGGNNSGHRIGAVDDRGDVHPDQFWQSYSLGNVMQRKFGDIWTDMSEPLLRGLRNRKELLKGRCYRCNYLDICNGNLRVRAEAVYSDTWAEDPACYLSEQEISS